MILLINILVTHSAKATAAQIKQFVDNDPTLSALIEVDVEGDGSGVVDDMFSGYNRRAFYRWTRYEHRF